MSTTVRIHITRDILERSARCEYYNDGSILGTNCAFALGVRDIWPNAFIRSREIIPFCPPAQEECIAVTAHKAVKRGEFLPVSPEMEDFIEIFDRSSPQQRAILPEESFDLEVPDWVIERIDISKLMESPTLELVHS